MNEENILRMTGGEAMSEMLHSYGAEYIFGIGGFQLMTFYDALCRAGNRRPQHILANDERTGAFAADAYARVSGKVGFCDGTLGPGATNLTTGLVEAATAGIPLVAFIGDANRDHSEKNMTQETRQAEILAPIAKEVIRVERGHWVANEFIRSADLIIGLGCKFGEIATVRYTLIPKEAALIHIDISPEEIGRHQKAAVGLWADARLGWQTFWKKSGRMRPARPGCGKAISRKSKRRKKSGERRT